MFFFSLPVSCEEFSELWIGQVHVASCYVAHLNHTILVLAIDKLMVAPVEIYKASLVLGLYIYSTLVVQLGPCLKDSLEGHGGYWPRQCYEVWGRIVWGGGGGDCMFGVGWWVVLTPLSPSIQLMPVAFEHSVLRIQEIYGSYAP